MRLSRGYSLVLVVVAAALAAFPALGGASPKAHSSAVTVKLGDNYFVRKSGVPTVTVRKGSTVRWLWTGRKPHDVSVVSGPQRFTTPLKINGSFSRRLAKAGTYKIICTLHGAADMSMRLRVR